MADWEGRNVFLSGPITGKDGWNRKAFSEAASMIRGLGADDVYNPAHLSPIGGVPPKPHEAYMVVTLHELTVAMWDAGSGSYVPYYDVIALLPGFEDSEGSMVELAVAEQIGLEVVVL